MMHEMNIRLLPMARALALLLLAGSAAQDDEEARQQWPLIFAAGEGDATTVASLLASGVDVGQRSKDGETALHVAAIKGNMATVRALLAAGAEVDARTPKGSTLFMTPMMWAIYHGHTPMVQALLQAGADPSSADEHGKSVVTMSQEARQPAIEAELRLRLAAMRTGSRPPAVGLGLYYTPPGEATYNIVTAALQRGYRHLDTAGFYENEHDVGRAVADFLATSSVRRDQLHLTSKAWPQVRAGGSNGLRCKPHSSHLCLVHSRSQESGAWVEAPYETMLAAVHESVRQLGMPIDLYLLHAPFNGKAARIAYWRALEEAQVRHVHGACACAWARACGLIHVECGMGMGHAEAPETRTCAGLPTSHRIASHRIASHRIASLRFASPRFASAPLGPA